jgi:lipopolysaccharide assembly LptE-like protein
LNPSRTIPALCLIAACAGSCAYSTSAALLPPHLKTVAIPVFENGTTEYALPQEITDAVILRFVQDNHLRVVPERSASSVIRGKVVGYRNGVFGFSEQVRAQEYRVTITVSVIFKDLVKNREVWSETALTKTSNYYVTPVPGDTTAHTEVDGRREAVLKIADEILARSVQGW